MLGFDDGLLKRLAPEAIHSLKVVKLMKCMAGIWTWQLHLVSINERCRHSIYIEVSIASCISLVLSTWSFQRKEKREKTGKSTAL